MVDMAAPLADYLAPRVQPLGYLGEMFRVGANAPDVLLQFMHFTDALKDAVPFDISETVVLTVATLMENRYERDQHERLSLRNGLTRDWLQQIQALRPDLSTSMRLRNARPRLARSISSKTEAGASARRLTRWQRTSRPCRAWPSPFSSAAT